MGNYYNNSLALCAAIVLYLVVANNKGITPIFLAPGTSAPSHPHRPQEELPVCLDSLS